MIRVRQSMIDWITASIPLGRTILELGSGDGTTMELCGLYRLFSVEHDLNWMGKYPSHYIYAPLEDGWYDRSSLGALPDVYDLLIIDGPPKESREGVVKFFDWFRRDAVVVIDDVERGPERRVIDFLLGRGYVEFACDRRFEDKQWAAFRVGEIRPLG